MRELTQYGDPDAFAVLIQPVDDHDLQMIGSEIAEIRRLSDTPFRLIAYPVCDWNRDLSPWNAPAVFGKAEFGDGAFATLRTILSHTEDQSKTYYLGGYSLAGLFALWAAHETAVFRGVAAASPSVWFPGFTDYMKTHPIRTGAVYLSLGDRESKARNPVMASVGDRIKDAYDILRERGVGCVLEWNEGNHFKDPDRRTAKAFAWLLNRKDTP
jgi:hypothetical protein